mmetsp:Transcript_55775/g.172896  ORF Transcript_55775/g.172896 Transcript_55775/m.172896 type:complete len:282 (-) Transcript_55775:554-1399(-)
MHLLEELVEVKELVRNARGLRAAVPHVAVGDHQGALAQHGVLLRGQILLRRHELQDRPGPAVSLPNAEEFPHVVSLVSRDDAQRPVQDQDLRVAHHGAEDLQHLRLAGEQGAAPALWVQPQDLGGPLGDLPADAREHQPARHGVVPDLKRDEGHEDHQTGDLAHDLPVLWLQHARRQLQERHEGALRHVLGAYAHEAAQPDLRRHARPRPEVEAVALQRDAGALEHNLPFDPAVQGDLRTRARIQVRELLGVKQGGDPPQRDRGLHHVDQARVHLDQVLPI